MGGCSVKVGVNRSCRLEDLSAEGIMTVGGLENSPIVRSCGRRVVTDQQPVVKTCSIGGQSTA